MNRLFESFVFGFLRRHRAAILPGHCPTAPCSPIGGDGPAPGPPRGPRRLPPGPDIALRAPDGTFPLLLDTKYKALAPADRAAGVAQPTCTRCTPTPAATPAPASCSSTPRRRA